MDAIATVDVLTANNNDVNLVETRIVYILLDYFFPISPLARAKMTGIVNKVYYMSSPVSDICFRQSSNESAYLIAFEQL